jgi:hypothetical protein
VPQGALRAYWEETQEKDKCGRAEAAEEEEGGGGGGKRKKEKHQHAEEEDDERRCHLITPHNLARVPPSRATP